MDNKNDIERYFDQSIGSQEKEQIKKSLAEDSDKLLEIEVGEAIAESLASEEFKNRLQIIRETNGRDRFVWIYRIAAAVTLLAVTSIVVWRISFQKTPESLYDEYFTPYDGFVQARGDEDSISEGIELYNQGKYEEAITFYNKNLNISENPQVTLLVANCHLMLNDQNSSIELLKQIENHPDPLIQGNANWYLALAYLKNEDILNAKKSLAEIIQSNQPYKKNARKLLEESIFN